MTDRLRIFNRAGFLQTEFTASVDRSWTIGEQGMASFEVATGESYCTETNLQFGNWVLVESSTSNGSELFNPWVGTIKTRQWGKRIVAIAAAAPEFLLSQRVGLAEKKIKDLPPGAIFQEIINQANLQESTLLAIGDVYNDGKPREETITPQKLSDDLARIFERSVEEYQWRPFVTLEGKLIVYCDWLKQIGIDTDFTLWESKSGGNVESTSRVLVEDAPEANQIIASGSGLTWSARNNVTVTDEDSVDKYGLIQLSQNYPDVTNKATLEDNATDELQTKKNPARIYNLKALDVGDTLVNMKLGNRMILRLQNIGFSNGVLGTDVKIRIIGMYYEPKQGQKIEIAVEEIT